VRARIERGMRGELPETAKAGDACFARSHTRVVGNHRDAVGAAAETARSLGYDMQITTAPIVGEAREVGRAFGEKLRGLAARGSRRAVVAGGESTVEVRGDGSGGRTLEVALGAAFAIEGVVGATVLALATDGDDGPTGAAGAIATDDTVPRAQALGFDPHAALARNDTLPLFRALGDLVVTGPTESNVGDVVVGLFSA
jgi:hydroxypyruvate reductase